MNLKDKSMIVTGASSGIGRQIALKLAALGCQVTLGDVNERAGLDVVSDIETAGGRAQFVRTDISDESSVQHMVASAVSTYGQLDGACNSAAIPGCNKPLTEISVEDWDHGHAVNARGTFLCNKHEIAAMLEKGGSIVNISSTAAVRGLFGLADYSSTKASIVSVTRTAAIEFASQGVRVNAIMPGFTLTEHGKKSLKENPTLEAQTIALHPIGRGAEPEEIAEAVCWLLSDQASYVTGAVVAVDGGMTA